MPAAQGVYHEQDQVCGGGDRGSVAVNRHCCGMACTRRMPFARTVARRTCLSRLLCLGNHGVEVCERVRAGGVQRDTPFTIAGLHP
jgi:hypothetical protein